MWRRLNGDPIGDDISNIVEWKIKQELELGHKIKVCIGSDSVHKVNHIEFATVVVFLREGKGGFMFVNKEAIRSNMGIKERMITEVSKSVMVAFTICPILEKYHIALELHADINTDPSFKSNVALKEAMGYIRGMGYEFKAKPFAFASSCCADKAI
jgi:uncharacterized protein